MAKDATRSHLILSFRFAAESSAADWPSFPNTESMTPFSIAIHWMVIRTWWESGETKSQKTDRLKKKLHNKTQKENHWNLLHLHDVYIIRSYWVNMFAFPGCSSCSKWKNLLLKCTKKTKIKSMDFYASCMQQTDGSTIEHSAPKFTRLIHTRCN